MATHTDEERAPIAPATTSAVATTRKPETHSNPREHEGAMEDQISGTIAPAGSAFDDEPKQG